MVVHWARGLPSSPSRDQPVAPPRRDPAGRWRRDLIPAGTGGAEDPAPSPSLANTPVSSPQGETENHHNFGTQARLRCLASLLRIDAR